MGKMPRFNLSPEEDTPQQTESTVRNAMQQEPENESIPAEMRKPVPLANGLVKGTRRDKNGAVLPGMYPVKQVVGKGKDKRTVTHIVREDR